MNDCRQLGVLKDDHPGPGDIAAEVDVDVGTDLRHVTIEIAEVVECGPISGDADLVEPVLEVGDRVGAVETGEFEPVRPGAAHQQVVRPALRAARHCRRRRRG